MRKKLLTGQLTIMIFTLFVLTLSAQENAGDPDNIREGAVNIFVDCERCDMNYIRNEIPYVNYVRDVREADVYLLETRQSTGSGGSSYTYTFQGQGRYAGMQDTLVYNTNPDETSDQTRNGRTKMMAMGLLRYVAKTPLINEVEIGHSGNLENEEVIDRWNYWVFEIETQPNLELEESLKRFSWDNSFQATKITPDWKIELSFDQEFNQTKYIDSEEGTTDTYNRSSWSQENLIVKSLGDHWSAGGRIETGSSSFKNQKFMLSIFPSVEYNIYPYAESTHRQFRILGGAGFSYNDYIDTTIYDKVSENLFEAHLNFAYMIQEKWGQANISLNTSTYLHDLRKNMIELDGFIRIRIVKGLSLSLNGSVGRINNQLSLSKGDLDDAAVFLRLQELATAYRIDGRVGFVYTFGSIYNNVVNPRFGSGFRGGGGGGRFR